MNAKANSTTADEFTDDAEWEDVETESQIVFDTIGDEFIGEFVGWSESESKQIPQAHFKNAEGTYFTNCGWSLKQGLKDIKKGTVCRLLYVSTQPTGQATPMMIFKVQTKRTR
jgi:hypothetical protein